MDLVTSVVAVTRRRTAALWGRLQEECGEGVVSAAIAILIMAVIGVGLWAAADRWFGTMEGKVDSQIEDLEGADTEAGD